MPFLSTPYLSTPLHSNAPFWPLQGYIYVEAHKEAHVKDAMRGLRMIFNSHPPKLVPLREMVDAITVPRGTEKSIGGSGWAVGWVGRADGRVGRGGGRVGKRVVERVLAELGLGTRRNLRAGKTHAATFQRHRAPCAPPVDAPPCLPASLLPWSPSCCCCFQLLLLLLLQRRVPGCASAAVCTRGTWPR